MIFNMLFLTGFLGTLWYLIEFHIFIRRSEKLHHASGGDPKNLYRAGLNRNIYYLGVVFGVNKMQQEIFAKYKFQIIRIRILFIIVAVAYFPLIISSK